MATRISGSATPEKSRDAALRPLVAQLVAERQRARAEKLVRAVLARRAERRHGVEHFAAGNLSLAALTATPVGMSHTVTTPTGRQVTWQVIDHAVATKAT
jgi:hypothetical protein